MRMRICLLAIDTIVLVILSIATTVSRMADLLFVKSLDRLLKYQKPWQEFSRFAPALSLKVPGFALNTDRCFVRFHVLLMRFCRRQNGRPPAFAGHCSAVLAS